MELTQPEIIQLLRKRLGLNQGDFGAKTFHTSFESGRTKVKNIELGKQVPTDDDLRKMANVLGVSVLSIMPGPSSSKAGSTPLERIYVTSKVLKYYPDLGTYLEMLNKAVLIDDNGLIEYIAGKIALILRKPDILKAVGG